MTPQEKRTVAEAACKSAVAHGMASGLTVRETAATLLMVSAHLLGQTGMAKEVILEIAEAAVLARSDIAAAKPRGTA
jgi:hypothetical protein